MLKHAEAFEWELALLSQSEVLDLFICAGSKPYGSPAKWRNGNCDAPS